jgi:hypothetical protein
VPMGQDMDLPAADESPVQKKSAPRSKGESTGFFSKPRLGSP